MDHAVGISILLHVHLNNQQFLANTTVITNVCWRVCCGK